MTTAKPDSLWTRTFLLLCAAQFLGYAQNAMLAPILPLYVTQLGGSPFIVGMVLATFAATSVIIRPLVGHWADRWSEAGVMIAGLLFQGASIFFCFIPWIGTTMLANGLRGIGWGGLNTGGYSLLAHIAPQSRRGEASGVYSGVQSASSILFPAFALWLLQVWFGGFTAAFLATAIFSWIGAALGATMARHVTHRARSNASPELSRQWWREIFHFIELDILLPSVMLLWLNLSLPSITTRSMVWPMRTSWASSISALFSSSSASRACSRVRCSDAFRIKSAAIFRSPQDLACRSSACWRSRRFRLSPA